MTLSAGFARAIALGLIAAWAGASAPGAMAQSYDGCFVNGRQVADSMCQGGGGGAAPPITANPAYGDLMSMSRMLGGAIVKSLMSPPPGAAAPPAPAASPSSAAGRSAAANNAGVALHDQGNYAAALEKFRQAVAIDPGNAVAEANYWHTKAALDHQSGNDDEALSDVERALTYLPHYPAAEADKKLYADAVAQRNAKRASDSDARVVAARLSQQAADADARSLADSLTRQQQQRQAAAAAGIIGPGDVLKDACCSNQSLAQSGQNSPQPPNPPSPPPPPKPPKMKRVFKTESQCQAEYKRRLKACDHPDWTDAICADKAIHWKEDVCEAHLTAEGWGH